MTSLDLDVQQRVCDLILPLTRLDGSHIVRQSTLAHDTTIGATAITLASAAGFAAADGLRFHDTLGEETLYATRVDHTAQTVNLNFGGLGYAGLQHVHTAGTIVSTGLFPFTPWDVTPMVVGGDCAIFIAVLRYPTQLYGMSAIHATRVYTHLQYHRTLQSDDSGINDNNWAERQEVLTRTDIGLINDCLLTHQTLMTDDLPGIAAQLSPINGAGDCTVVEMGRGRIQQSTTWHYIGTIDAIYAMDPKPYRPT